MEIAYKQYRDNISTYYQDVFRCYRCAEGCTTCTNSAPCLATYRWPLRVALLIISIMCAFATIVLSCYLYGHRKVKVFKVASPIFLTITLLGCAIMYLEVMWPYFFSVLVCLSKACGPNIPTCGMILTKWENVKLVRSTLWEMFNFMKGGKSFSIYIKNKTKQNNKKCFQSVLKM